MAKRFSVICFILAAALTAGCSGAAPPGSAPAAAPPMAAANDAAYEEYGGESGETAEAQDVPRMIIRNASLEIESNDSQALYAGIAGKLAQLGGYEAYHDITNYDTFSVINAEIRVPADKFDELIAYINESAKVINSRVNSEDITEQYYDVEIRLQTKRASLQKYYDLLSEAQNVDEIIQLQRTIDGLTEEIESMEGKLRLWNSQVNMSAVSLLIRQENDPVKIQKDIDWNALSLSDMGHLIRNGFMNTLDRIVVLLQWLVITALSLSPLLALAVIGYFAARKLGVKLPKWKRKNSKGKNGEEETKE